MAISARREISPSSLRRCAVASTDLIMAPFDALDSIAGECKSGALEVVNHTRAVKHRLLEISRSTKCLTQTNQQRENLRTCIFLVQICK
jgi:hypothetical protein